MEAKVPTKKTKIGLGIVAGVVIFLLITWAQYVLLNKSYNYANQDFMTLWTGGRALVEHVNPYDAEIWQPLRVRYGSTWMPNLTAPYPVWVFILMLPFY